MLHAKCAVEAVNAAMPAKAPDIPKYSVMLAFRKNPVDILDYQVNMTSWLTMGDSVLSYTWTVPSPLTLLSQVDVGATSTGFIGGGLDQERYTVSVEITTAGGRTKIVEFQLAVFA